MQPLLTNVKEYGIKDIAKLLPIGEQQIRCYIKAGELKATLKRCRYRVKQNYYFLVNGKIKAKNRLEYDQQEYWNANFFNTSLGWIRRKPVMKDGTVKDFLNDCLPIIKMGLTEAGLPQGAVIRYATPDYKQELTSEYIETLQDNSAITYEQGVQFINECITRFLADFTG